jgi:hypothetical protein
MKRARPALLLACMLGFAGARALSAQSAGGPADVSGPLSLSVSAGAPAQGAPLLVTVAASAPVDNLVLMWKGTT